jgi:predicted nucleotidyltransferase component of viral defense system
MAHAEPDPDILLGHRSSTMQDADTSGNILYPYGMPQSTDVQLIELFHLLFLQALGSSRSQGWYVLKGGANIRYFFSGPCYSNDIDLDVVGKEGRQVEEVVSSVLQGPALRVIARKAGIEVTDLSSPKQTDATRRWELGLKRLKTSRHPARTKIEFSARGTASDDVEFSRVPDDIVAPYGMASPMVQHYGLTAAAEQKIAALALRSATKARDVFDLDLLLRQRGVKPAPIRPLAAEHALAAAERAIDVTYAAYRSEVLPFIDPEVLAIYDQKGAWETMRERVVRQLELLTDSHDGGGPR